MVAGILIAFEFEDAREEHAERGVQNTYLERLEAQLDSFAHRLGMRLVTRTHRADAVLHVAASLDAGTIIANDVKRFDFGLVHVFALPSIGLPRATLDGMISTGVLAGLDDEELKVAIADLFELDAENQNLFDWWRDGVLRSAEPVLQREVDMSAGRLHPNRGVDVFVSYDFDALAANRELRNAFWWAADAHYDFMRRLTRLQREIDQVRRLLKRRRLHLQA